MYKTTQTRIQTYLNDVAGVRIVCVFALAFCVIFYWFMPKKKESEVTVHAE